MVCMGVSLVRVYGRCAMMADKYEVWDMLSMVLHVGRRGKGIWSLHEGIGESWGFEYAFDDTARRLICLG
jgi:hypothetical protein